MPQNDVYAFTSPEHATSGNQRPPPRTGAPWTLPLGLYFVFLELSVPLSTHQ